MEDEKYQKELFEFEKPRKLFPRLSNIFPKADFEGRIAITLSLEKMIFISIGIIMLMVIIYAIGVEKGKALNRPAIVFANVKPSQILPSLPVMQVRTLPVAPKVVTSAPVLPAAQRNKVAASAIQPYTIAVGAFRQKDLAAQESGRVKKEGLEPFTMQSGSYILVCVGAYANRAEAQKALNKIRQNYRDAYIKLR